MRLRRGVITRDPLLDWLYPELSHCADDDERRALLKSAKELGRPMLIGTVAGCALLLVLATPSLFFVLRPFWLPRQALALLIGCHVAGFLFGVALLSRRARRRAMRRWLNARGRSLCVECGYDRTIGDASRAAARCPECGSPDHPARVQ